MSETADTSNDSTTAETEETLDEAQKPKRKDSELVTSTDAGVGDPPGGDPSDPDDTPPGGSA